MDWLKELITSLDSKIDKIDQRLDTIETKMDVDNKEFVEMKSDVKYHISRTDELQKITTDLYKKYQQLVGMGKLILGVGILFGLFETITKFFS